MKTPADLGIKKGTVIAPEGGWKEGTYYLVWVAFSSTNTIHKAIFYSGFLDEGKPSGYSTLFNHKYEDNKSISSTYYLKVIEDLKINLKG